MSIHSEIEGDVSPINESLTLARARAAGPTIDGVRPFPAISIGVDRTGLSPRFDPERRIIESLWEGRAVHQTV
jgi:hypothetical protein